ncbi:hypothetical protein Hanom_Chr03g00234041 [Helianthus anomalus]
MDDPDEQHMDPGIHGTNLDFSAYSSEHKKVLVASQLQLNYLATASDLGKAFGWSSGLAPLYMPLWLVVFVRLQWVSLFWDAF